MRKYPRSSLLPVLSLLTACGSSHSTPTDAAPAPSSSTAPDPACPKDLLCDLQGMPFVRAALASTDSSGAPGEAPPEPGQTQATVTQPEPGKVCMSGRVEAGWAWLTLVFAKWGTSGFTNELDTTGLGIERFEFTLESLPQVGVNVQLVSGVPDCTSDPVACQHWGFLLNTGEPPSTFVTNQDGIVNAPIAAFVRSADTDSSWVFDPSALTTLQIGPGARGSVTGDLDFCVSHLRFLDAHGAEVLPLR